MKGLRNNIIFIITMRPKIDKMHNYIINNCKNCLDIYYIKYVFSIQKQVKFTFIIVYCIMNIISVIKE